MASAPTADVRGASGAVDDVWLAFAAAGCPVVVGVAGNHDVIPPGGLGAIRRVAGGMGMNSVRIAPRIFPYQGAFRISIARSASPWRTGWWGGGTTR